MKNAIKLALVLTTALCLASDPAFAKPKHKGQETYEFKTEKTVEEATANVVDRLFTEAERAIIEEYLGVKVSDKDHDHHDGDKKGLPPGLAKKDKLPPGLQKQIERNGQLPPGLAKRDLPDDLTAKLPSCKKGKCYIVDDTVVLVDAATEIVTDLIKEAIKNP